MRPALGPGHREFFTKNGYIEFEDLVLDFGIAQEHIDQQLFNRSKKIIDTRTPKELFIAGRDLFRDDPVIRKITQNRILAQTASILFDISPVRLAYDQALRTTTLTGPPFTHPFSLAQVSCFQSLFCGAIIRLLPDPHPPAFLPQKPGGVVFFRPDFPLPWSSIFQTPSQSFLLIAYAPKKCQYVLSHEDLLTHSLKNLGYTFGDFLKEDTHPILYK